MPDVPHGVLHSSSPDEEAPALASVKAAIEAEHRCSARFSSSVLVWELLKGEIVEERTVHVFDLVGHKEALAAYAWRTRSGIVIVPHGEGVFGPVDAVQKAILGRP